MAGNLTLFDSANILMRAIYAVGYRDHPGIASQPLSTFANLVAKYVRITYPSKVVMCWDGGASTFRLGLLPTYKGNRIAAPTEEERDGKSIFEKAKVLAYGLGLDQVELPGVEADDLIATYVSQYSLTNRISIISSDKDFNQLLNDNVTIWHPGENTPVTTESFIESNGYDPHHHAKVLALTGDKVDNIPGVGGVGIKTATKLLKQADWDIGTLINQQPPEFNKDVLVRNLALVDLQSGYVNDPLPSIKDFNPVTGPKDYRWKSRLLPILDEYNLRMLKHSLTQGSFWEIDGTIHNTN